MIERKSEEPVHVDEFSKQSVTLSEPVMSLMAMIDQLRGITIAVHCKNLW